MTASQRAGSALNSPQMTPTATVLAKSLLPIPAAIPEKGTSTNAGWLTTAFLAEDDGVRRDPCLQMRHALLVEQYRHVAFFGIGGDPPRRHADLGGIDAAADPGHVFLGGEEVIPLLLQDPRKQRFDGLDALPGFPGQDDIHAVVQFSHLALLPD